MVDSEIFECIVKNTSLISIDFVVKKKDKILLGKRINNPAKGYWFTIGGRIYKNEKISEAQKRILKNELDYEGKFEPAFIGVFEHFYDTGFNGVPTHYVNLAYMINLDKISLNLPFEQHSEYIWLEVDEIMKRKDVHSYVKNYFKGNKYV